MEREGGDGARGGRWREGGEIEGKEDLGRGREGGDGARRGDTGRDSLQGSRAVIPAL